MNTIEPTGMEPFVSIMQRAEARSVRRRQNEEMSEMVRLIDKLSGEMGSSDFRQAVRAFGYDIDACLSTLATRGVAINN